MRREPSAVLSSRKARGKMESASATDAAADALAKTEIAATTEPADAISPEAAARKGALDAWSVTLAEHDAAWAALQTEKKLGWESAAVDWHWKKQCARKSRNSSDGSSLTFFCFAI